MHIDEDLAQLPVFILAGVDIDLVTAHGGLLDIALAAVGQAAAGAVALDDLFNDPFGWLSEGRRGRLAPSDRF